MANDPRIQSQHLGEDGQGTHYLLVVYVDRRRELIQLKLPLSRTKLVRLEPVGVPIPMWE